MAEVLYVDADVIVAVKEAGVEAQAARGLARDMVSELKKYLVIHKLSTPGREPYVGVIHRLDKPVSGVMVYARTKGTAAALSRQLQRHEMTKEYTAVVCGKPEKPVDNYVDELLQSVDGNYSKVVDKGEAGGKRAELTVSLVKTLPYTGEIAGLGELSLVKLRLKTGRHHQIRVQLAAHGLPIYGDRKYNPLFGGQSPETGSGNRAAALADRKYGEALALCASRLAFAHPRTGKAMEFSIRPETGIFQLFSNFLL